MGKFTVADIDNINVFFILGRPRSGTTLLRTLFDAHPNVSIPFEGRVIAKLYFKYSKEKKWTEKKLINFYNDLFKIKDIAAWEFSPDLKLEMLRLGNNATFERLIKVVYLNVNSLFKKEKIILIGDKNPYYSIRKSYYKILKSTFPNAKIIHLVRDYRAHYNSMAKIDFENTQMGNVAWRWVYSYNIIKSAFANSPNYIFLKHEDLTKNPEQELKRLCGFLNIDYQSSMLEFYKIKDVVLAKYGKEVLKIHSSLLNPVTDGFNDKWKAALTEKQIKYLDSFVGENAEIIGYKRVYKESGQLLSKLFFGFYNHLYFMYARFNNL